MVLKYGSIDQLEIDINFEVVICHVTPHRFKNGYVRYMANMTGLERLCYCLVGESSTSRESGTTAGCTRVAF